MAVNNTCNAEALKQIQRMHCIQGYTCTVLTFYQPCFHSLSQFTDDAQQAFKRTTVVAINSYCQMSGCTSLTMYVLPQLNICDSTQGRSQDLRKGVS